MKSGFPKTTVIVLNWNGGIDTLACLDSLKKVVYPNFEVVVVDNGSSDGSQEEIRRIHSGMVLIETGENSGYVGGNNVGLEHAIENGAEYALLLNNDTEVSPGFLDGLVAALEADPAAAIAGPSIYYHSAPNVVWSVGGAIDRKHGLTNMIGIGEVDRGQFGDVPRQVDFVTGCALLIKTQVVREIGMLDPRFFAYYEETEWCVRAAQRGYSCLHVPCSKVWHKISPVAREASTQVHYYMTRNRLLFLKLTRAGLSPLIYTLLFDYARTLLSWTFKPRWRDKRPQRQAMLQAIRDYINNRFGRVDLN